MGCDIHLFVEQLDGSNTWGLLAPPDDGKNYSKFSDEENAKRCDYRYGSGDRHPENPAYRIWDEAERRKPLADLLTSPEGRPSLAEWFSDRNYDLFAMLANVRNGYGFAGVDTGDAFTPIAMPRGVCEGSSPEYKAEVESWGIDGHSHTYFTVGELRTYFSAMGDKGRMASGCVTARQYLELRDTKTKPTTWSGGISGRDILVVSASDFDMLERRGLLTVEEEETDGFARTSGTTIKAAHIVSIIEGMHGGPESYRVYVRAEWPMTYQQEAGENFFKLLDELSAIGPDDDSIRIVCFFDN